MIVQNDHAVAVVSQQMETAQAQIAMTPEMMELLSSGIYTDKILAVVREVSCNALDGHRLGGNEAPIEVHLPTTWEQWFSVRDRGVGLSHEDVMNLYMTYGDSRKRNTNTLIGGFGIGCKSPFAYTDAFTVTSWFDGYKRVYSIYKNAGIPQCTLLTTEESSEDVGIEVKVPSNANDVYTFREKATKVFTAFKTKPTVNVDVSMELAVVADTDTYFTTDAQYNSGSFYAQVGDVIYGVDHDIVSEFFNLVSRNHNYYLKLEIGSVSVAGSREKLSMDARTEEHIKEVIEVMKDTVIQERIDKVEAAESIFKFREMLENEVDAVKDNAEHEGRSLSEWKKSLDIELDEAVEYFHRDYSGTKRRSTKDGSVFNPLRSKTNERIVFLKDTKVGGITEFKDICAYKNKVTFPLFECEIKMNEFITKFMWTGCKIERSSVLRANKPKRAIKAIEQVEVMHKNRDGRIVTRTLENFDIKNVQKDVLFVETYRHGWIQESPINGVLHTQVEDRYTRFDDAIENGYISSIFFIRSATVKKILNPKSRVHNPHFKRFVIEDVMGDQVELEQREALALQLIKNRTSVDKIAYDLFGDTDLFTKKEKRLIVISEKELTGDQRLALGKFTLKSKWVGGNVSKIHDRVSRSIKTIGDDITTRIVRQYPFMELFVRYDKLTIDETMLEYVQHLIKETDNGTFDKEPEVEEDIVDIDFDDSIPF